ncbi:MAG TPA: hypothetical protein VMZ91_13125 [Candidatus Paceibacterota bacterium]|nr:hypothetical protein [Candidatus Paceibacterota bacterium]
MAFYIHSDLINQKINLLIHIFANYRPYKYLGDFVLFRDNQGKWKSFHDSNSEHNKCNKPKIKKVEKLVNGYIVRR